MGAVDDVADTVEYLTGPLSGWISGQQLVVSGRHGLDAMPMVVVPGLFRLPFVRTGEAPVAW